jgi:hypothetical protein
MLSRQFDLCLLNLAWSLWTELGVAGTKQKHQETLILIEELVLFTSVLAEIDPRLRDESLDWCSQFHHFISTSRLKSLMKDFETWMHDPFSQYAAQMNAISQANWPVLTNAPASKVILSRKSVLRPHASPALLNIRARALFGTGARADLVTFFLIHPTTHFSIGEVAGEIGYTKRNLAEVLDDLHLGGLFNRFMQGNQQRYRLIENNRLFEALEPLPKQAPPWRRLFRVLLSLRACISQIEDSSESTQVVEIRNCLATLEPLLQKLEKTPPPLQKNLSMYLEAFKDWLLKWATQLAEGTF